MTSKPTVIDIRFAGIEPLELAQLEAVTEQMFDQMRGQLSESKTPVAFMLLCASGTRICTASMLGPEPAAHVLRVALEGAPDAVEMGVKH